jgi:hypothetical protein
MSMFAHLNASKMDGLETSDPICAIKPAYNKILKRQVYEDTGIAVQCSHLSLINAQSHARGRRQRMRKYLTVLRYPFQRQLIGPFLGQHLP